MQICTQKYITSRQSGVHLHLKSATASQFNSETETATQRLFNWRKFNSDNLLELLKMSAKASSELNESTGRSQHCTIHHTYNSIDMCKLGWLYEIDILHFTPVSIVTGWDVIHWQEVVDTMIQSYTKDIMSLLSSVLLQVCSMSNNANENKWFIFFLV